MSEARIGLPEATASSRTFDSPSALDDDARRKGFSKVYQLHYDSSYMSYFFSPDMEFLDDLG